ncbi:hypothetical protein JCM10296v2_003168 [Rhodotorula toruloides]
MFPPSKGWTRNDWQVYPEEDEKGCASGAVKEGQQQAALTSTLSCSTTKPDKTQAMDASPGPATGWLSKLDDFSKPYNLQVRFSDGDDEEDLAAKAQLWDSTSDQRDDLFGRVEFWHSEDGAMMAYSEPLDLRAIADRCNAAADKDPLKELCQDGDLVMDGKTVDEGVDRRMKVYTFASSRYC